MNGNPKETIGVLGGMGATVSAEFYRDLVARSQRDYGATADDDFPTMIVYNLSVRDFDETGFVDVESVKIQLVDAVQKLEGAGSNFIVIPCNTVHLLIEDMRSAIQIPIVSIIDAVVETVTTPGVSTVGLLSSQSTKETDLYEQAFTAAGIAVVGTTDEEQQQVNEIIGHVMAGTHDAKDALILKEFALRMQQAGAETIVLGCTELPLAFTEEISIPVVSSNAALAQAALARAYGS